MLFGRLIPHLFVVLAIVLGGGTACAQTTSSQTSKYPIVSSKCEPTSITVGDRVKFTVSIVAPELQRLVVRDAFSDKEQTTWTLVGKAVVTDTKLSGNESRRNIDYTLTTFERGEVEIPPVEVRYQPPGGGEPVVRDVSGIAVNVNSVLPADAASAALRDIKGPVPVPLPAWINWTIAAVAAVVFLLIAFFIWRRMRGKLGQFMNPALRPDEWALLQIEECEREKLIEQKKLKELYTRLSDTLRQYLGKAYDLKAMDMTTGELLTHLEDAEGYEPLPNRADFRSARQRLSELLDEADLVKFARFLPEPARSRHAIEKAREVVRLSRYKLEPPPADQAGAAGQPPHDNPPPPPPPPSGTSPEEYESQRFARPAATGYQAEVRR